MRTVEYLAEQSLQRISKSRFKKIEQSLGFNHNDLGFLRSEIITLRPATQIMFDWMHVYCVAGIWNNESGSLVTKLSSGGLSQADLDMELSRFKWPRALSSRGVTGQNIFSKEDQDGVVSCSASECLSVYGVLRFILHECRRRGELESLKAECDSYCRLCRVLDLLQHQKKHGWKPVLLKDAIEEHLRGYAAIYDRFLPKHHYSLHLAAQCAQHGTLVSCWVHERKHREIKKRANLITNTWGRFERTVIVDAMNDMLAALAGAPEEPYYGGICSPCPAGAPILREFRNMGLEGPMFVSRSAYFSPGSRAWAGDVVILVADGNDPCIGEVNFFAKCGEDNLVCVTAWKSIGENNFRKGQQSFVANLNDIVDVCVHCESDEVGVAKVVPVTTWPGF